MSADQDIFIAYGLYQTGLSSAEIQKKINEIAKIKKTYPYLYNVIYSDRKPITIMKEAEKIGMFIPPFKRYGTQTYLFYINNINYYENIFNRLYLTYPSELEIIRSSDPYELLSMYTDSEIRKDGLMFLLNYNNRKEMIEHLIENNYKIFGVFSLPYNSRSKYDLMTPLILYNENGVQSVYSISFFLNNYDQKKKLIYKEQNLPFNILSLYQLRHKILEKFPKWKDMSEYTSYYFIDGEKKAFKDHILISLVKILDEICIHLDKPNKSSYIDTPKIFI